MKNKENSWKEKKAEGDVFELYSVRDIQRKKYSKAFIDDRGKKFDLWDIYISETIKIECKNDEKGLETKNICIEIGCDGNPSGLSVTQAEYWLISGGVLTFLIHTATLKKLIQEEYKDKLNLYINSDNNGPLNLNGILFQEKYPVLQGDNTTKYMDWYLIPQKFFAGFCLEVAEGDKMTYEKIVP